MNGKSSVSDSRKYPSQTRASPLNLSQDLQFPIQSQWHVSIIGRREAKLVQLKLFIESFCPDIGEHFQVKHYKDGHEFDDEITEVVST